MIWRGIIRGLNHRPVLIPKLVPSSSLRMMSSGLIAELRFGETVLVEDDHGNKKLVHLKEGGRHCTRRGNLLHSDIAGNQPGTSFSTHAGLKVTVRRPRLDEYVLLFHRGPTPSYTKDIWAMVGMMDISPGDMVVEAGSGSGSLTLYLSRAG